MTNVNGHNVRLPIVATNNVLGGFANDIGSGVKAIGVELINNSQIKIFARDVTQNGMLANAYLRWFVFCI